MVECIEKVRGLVARLNFGIKQFYNVIILGPVTKVMEVEQWFEQNHGGKNEVGFYIPGITLQVNKMFLLNLVFSIERNVDHFLRQKWLN